MKKFKLLIAPLAVLFMAAALTLVVPTQTKNISAEATSYETFYISLGGTDLISLDTESVNLGYGYKTNLLEISAPISFGGSNYSSEQDCIVTCSTNSVGVLSSGIQDRQFSATFEGYGIYYFDFVVTVDVTISYEQSIPIYVVPNDKPSLFLEKTELDGVTNRTYLLNDQTYVVPPQGETLKFIFFDGRDGLSIYNDFMEVNFITSDYNYNSESLEQDYGSTFVDIFRYVYTLEMPKTTEQQLKHTIYVTFLTRDLRNSGLPNIVTYKTSFSIVMCEDNADILNPINANIFQTVEDQAYTFVTEFGSDYSVDFSLSTEQLSVSSLADLSTYQYKSLLTPESGYATYNGKSLVITDLAGYFDNNLPKNGCYLNAFIRDVSGEIVAFKSLFFSLELSDDDRQILATDFDERLRLAYAEGVSGFLENDAEILSIYNTYLGFDEGTKALISEKAALNEVLSYYANRAALLELKDKLNTFSSNNQIGAELYNYFKQVQSSVERYFDSDVADGLNLVKRYLETTISGITLNGGKNVYIVLDPKNADSSNGNDLSYTVSVDEEFSATGLELYWIVADNECVNYYEEGGSSIYLWPYALGSCKLIASYKTLDGKTFFDEVTVTVLDSAINGIVNIEKTGEGAYSTYDTLNMSVSLSAQLVLSDTAKFVWKIDDVVLPDTTKNITYKFATSGVHKVECIINDTDIGLENITATRTVNVTEIRDAEFTLTTDYPDGIYAYLSGGTFRINAYLDGFVNEDFEYNWTILNRDILGFYVNSDGPEIAFTPLKVGETIISVSVNTGKLEDKILTKNIAITVFDTIDSLKITRTSDNLKPGVSLFCRATANDYPSVVNLGNSWEVLLDGEALTYETQAGGIVINNAALGNYEIKTTVNGITQTLTFKVQSVPIEEILLAVLPFLIVAAGVVVVIRLIYSRRRTNLQSLANRVLSIGNKTIELADSLIKITDEKQAQKLFLKGAKRIKFELNNSVIATISLDRRENLELDVAERNLANLLFIVRAGIKAFGTEYDNKRVVAFLKKINKTNFGELNTYFDQKIATVNAKKSSEAVDQFATLKVKKEKHSVEKFASPKDYTDYLRKKHYYDADDDDGEKDD